MKRNTKRTNRVIVKVLSILSRLYVDPDEIESSITFYEELMGEECSLRFTYELAGITLATVGKVLLIAGPEKRLEKFRRVQATLMVDSLDAFRTMLAKRGCEILDDAKPLPMGNNMLVRHPDGNVVEYIEHGPDNGLS